MGHIPEYVLVKWDKVHPVEYKTRDSIFRIEAWILRTCEYHKVM